MTREDAIYEIKQLAVLSTKRNIDRITEALEMAIEALRKTEPQTCDDCIWSVCNYIKIFEDEPQTEREGE